MTNFYDDFKNCRQRLDEVVKHRDRLRAELKEIKAQTGQHNQEIVKFLKDTSKLKNVVRDLQERFEHNEQFTSEIVNWIVKNVPFEHWPKLQCLYCDGPIDFQKDHSVYHIACQKRAKSARRYARSKETETLQEDAVDTILCMLKIIEGEPIHINLVFRSVIEVAKILKQPEVERDLFPPEKEFLKSINEAIDKFKKESERQRRA